MDNIYKQQYLKEYNNFIEQLKVIFPSEETMEILNVLSQTDDKTKMNNGKLFALLINNENLDLFIKNKIKVFSHKSPDTQKISESLFGPEFSIKNLLNNQPEEVKKVIWISLHTLCLLGEYLNSNESSINNEKIELLNQVILKERGTKQTEPTETPQSTNSTSGAQKLEDMLGVEVNGETKTMIDDIVSSFEKVLTGQSGGNPFGGIMEISQTISMKYADKINKGEIELDKIMESITKKIPGMDQMMSGMMGGMMGGKSKKAVPKEKILIDENFSTANVEVGLNKEPESKSFDIGGILKMADQFGVIPGGKQKEGASGMPDLGKMMGGMMEGMSGLPGMEGMPDLSKMMEGMSGLPGMEGMPDLSKMMEGMSGLPGMEGMPDLGKMMEMMTKLDKTESNEDTQALKQEMDTYLQKELGVDVDKLNAQLDDVTKKMKEDNSL